MYHVLQLQYCNSVNDRTIAFGHPRLLRSVRSDSRVACAGSVSRACIQTVRFRSAAHAVRMTRPHLFHTDTVSVSSRLPGRLAPTSSKTLPHSMCLLPTLPAAAYASSTHRWLRLGTARPHGHQRRQSIYTCNMKYSNATYI